MKKNIYFAILLIIPFVLFFSACGEINFKIIFMVDDIEYATINTKGSEAIQMPPNPSKLGYEFDGWFWDDNTFQRPFTANSLLNEQLSSDMRVYAKWSNSGTNNFVYNVDRGKASITLFINTNNLTSIVVPNIINTFPVTSIGANAFANQTLLRNVVVCDGIEIIDASAFSGCNSMEHITLPNTLKTIGASAFANCELLQQISFPASLRTIYQDAFSGCSSLQNASFANDNWWVADDKNLFFDSFIDTSNSNVIAENLTTSKNNKIWTNYTLYNINYNLDNGILPNNAQMYFSEYTTTFDLLNSQKKGYDFAGYYGNNNFSGNQITQVIKGTKNNITIYAQYSLITYSINYVLNDGTNNPNNSLTYNIEMDNIQLLDAQKDYYDFSNWTSGNKVITEIDTSLCTDLEVTANYTPTIYTITYVLNGGINNENNPITYTIETPTITLIPATFENETVSRWYLEENFDNRITNILAGSHEDLMLYARKGYDGYDTCVISNNVVTSLNSSFINEFNITDIIIPSNVTSINTNAFVNKTFITSIIMPKSINSLAAGILAGCSGIKSIVLPFVGTSLGTTNGYIYPFGYLFGTNSYTDGVRIGQYRYKPDSSEKSYMYYYLPSGLEYVKVLSGIIGCYAFQGCSMIQNIELTNDILEIGDYAFTGCISLKSFVVPGSVTSIGKYAFSGCRSIKTFEIKNGVKTIKDLVFDNTIWRDGSGGGGFEMALEEIIIPQSVTKIGNRIFGGSYNLKTIIVDINNQIYDSRDNCNAIIETANNSLIAGCNNTTIPNDITSISNYAFYECNNLTSITIPSGVTSIGEYTFYRCSNLSSIIIPSGVTSIGDCAFYLCRNLFSVTFESGSQLQSIGEHAFSDCNILTSIIIPSGVTSIGKYAFYRCNITSIIIPSGVTSIGDCAFYCCYIVEVVNKSSLTITAGATTNGDVAYYAKQVITDEADTKLVTSNGVIYYIDVASKIAVGVVEANTTSIVLDADCTEINGYAFYYCYNLTSIIIPSVVTSIGKYAFYSCGRLTTIYYGGTGETEWNAIKIYGPQGNSFDAIARYYYSHDMPMDDGQYWHYVDGEPTIWE